ADEIRGGRTLDEVVGVGVDVNEARRDDQASGVDRLGGLPARDAADRGDPAIFDADVLSRRGAAAAIDDEAAADHEVVAGRLCDRARAAGQDESGGDAREPPAARHRAACGFVSSDTVTPTTMTTMTPIGLCQRYETPLVAGANAKNTTNAMPLSSPMKAPWPFRRLKVSAR